MFFSFSLLQQQVFGPSDTVSLNNKNMKYTWLELKDLPLESSETAQTQ
jgi:hypothetical protein